MTPGQGAVGRASAYAVVLVGACVNGLYFGMAAATRELGLTAAAANLFSVSAIIWIALFAMLHLSTDGGAAPLRRADRWVLGAGLLLCFLPAGWEARLAVALLSLFLLATSPPATPERRVAVIGVSLLFPLIVGRIALALFAPEILRIDAALTGAVTGHDVQGNTVAFAAGALASEGRRMIIFTGCSSLANMSLTAVVTALVSQIFDIPFDRRLLALAGAMALAVFAINLGRLAALASFPDHFAWLHSGAGATMFAYFALIAIGALVAVALRYRWLVARA